jgi:adenylate kinase
MRNRQRRRSPGALVLLGLPGSGKGTQATRLAAALRIPAVSTGEMLRREIESGSALGRAVRVVVEGGELADDGLVTSALAAHLGERAFARGFILDGFPRSLAQAVFLERWLGENRFEPPTVVYLHIDRDEVIARLASRVECPACRRTYAAQQERCPLDGSALTQRSDDQVHTVCERFRQYEASTSPLLEHYASAKFHWIAATGSPDEVFDRIRASLGSFVPPLSIARRIRNGAPRAASAWAG